MILKLTLLYRRIPLGVLEHNENGYAYTSYIENEQIAAGNLLLGPEYGLCGSFKRGSRKLFPVFEGILTKCSKREDILRRANIAPKESRWEKLVKLSQLQWFTPNYYVQQTGDTEEERKYYLKKYEKTTQPLPKDEEPSW
jgi:hypothetical protein